MKKPKLPPVGRKSSPKGGGEPTVKVYKSGGVRVKRPDVIETRGGTSLPMKPLYSRPKKNEQILQHNGMLIAKKGNKQGRPIALTGSNTMATLPKRKQKWASQDNARAIGMAFSGGGGNNTLSTPASPPKKKEFSELSARDQRDVLAMRAHEAKKAAARKMDTTAKKPIAKMPMMASKDRKKK